MQGIYVRYKIIDMQNFNASDLVIYLGDYVPDYSMFWQVYPDEYQNIIQNCIVDIKILPDDTVTNIVGKHISTIISIVTYIEKLIGDRIVSVVPTVTQNMVNELASIYTSGIDVETRILNLLPKHNIRKVIVDNLSHDNIPKFMNVLRPVTDEEFESIISNTPEYLLICRYYLGGFDVQTDMGQIGKELFRSLHCELALDDIYHIVSKFDIDSILRSNLPVPIVAQHIKDLIIRNNSKDCSKKALINIITDGRKKDRVFITGKLASGSSSWILLSKARRIIQSQKDMSNIIYWQTILELCPVRKVSTS